MAVDTRLAADHDPSAHGCAASNAGTTSHCRVLTNLHVVGDLDHVIQLHAVSNKRIVERPAVDRSIRTHLNIVAQHGTADLRNLHPRAATLTRVTKTIGTNHCARMNDAALAHHGLVIKRHIAV